MKRFLVFILALVFMFPGAALAQQDSYTASSDGMGGPVEVTVTFEGGQDRQRLPLALTMKRPVSATKP